MAEAEQQAQFEQLLLTLSSPDNGPRQQAEEVYNGYKKDHRAWLLQALATVGGQSQNPAAAQLGLILFRRNLNEEAGITGLDENALGYIKKTLLDRMGQESTKPVRKAAAGAISALAGKLSAEGGSGWVELWGLLVQTLSTGAGTEGVRGACCDVFGQVASTLATTYFKDNMRDICGALSRACADPSSEVRIKAFGAVVSFAVVIEEHQVPAFRDLVPTMLGAVTDCLTRQDFKTATELCSNVAALAETQSSIFQDKYTELLKLMMDIAQADPSVIEAKARHMAVEVIISLAEGNPKAIRKVKNFPATFFELLFSYMQRVPGIDEEWAMSYGSEDDDTKDETDFDIGTTGLDRFACATNGRNLRDVASTRIAANIADPQWTNRVAALSTITYIVEGCKKSFAEHLALILNSYVVPRVDDEHPRVRNAALQSIAQFCDDFSPDFQASHIKTVIPLVCGRLADPVPRNQALAVGTLNMFLNELEEYDKDEDETDPNEFVWPYVDMICRALISLLASTPHIFVKKEIFITLSSLIEVARLQMGPYVAQLVPLLQGVITQGADDQGDATTIKCRAIENLTLLASGVGMEYFRDHAHSVCSYLSQVLASGLKNDDMRLRFILRGWTCMVECMGSEILQYLPQVMNPLVQVADMPVDVDIQPRGVGEDSDEEDDDNKEVKTIRVVTPGEGEVTMRIHTSLVEDKDLAATIICSFLEELKGLMKDYLPKCTETATNLLGFKAFAETRDTAAQMLEAIAVAYAQADPSQLAGFMQYVAPRIWDQIQKEPDTQVAGQMVKSAGVLMEHAPRDCLDTTTIEKICAILVHIFTQSVKRVQECAQERAGLEEDDEEDLANLEEEEEDEDFLLSQIIECVQSFIKHTTFFIPYFERDFLPLTVKLVDPSMTDNEHRLGLCLLCDFVEWGKAAALPHLSSISSVFFQYASATDETVKQAGIFGCGVACELLGKTYPQPHAESAAFAKPTFDLVMAFLATPDSRQEAQHALAINAVATLLIILEHFSSSFDCSGVIPLIAQHLPGKDDTTEAKKVHHKLVQWASTPATSQVLGAHRTTILAAIRGSKNLTDETKALLAQMQ